MTTDHNSERNAQWLQEKLAELSEEEARTVAQGIESLAHLLSIHDSYFGKTLNQVLMKISLIMTRHFAQVEDNDEGEFLEEYTTVMELLQEFADRVSELDVEALKATGRKLGVEVF